jgi:CRP/FNR family transcriptional regulator
VLNLSFFWFADRGDLKMELNGMGKIYKDTEIIVRQGDSGENMYVIQEGLVEIIRETEQGEIQLALRGKGEFFGEMAIFERQARMATVRALGEARVLTIDKKNFLRRMHEDPSLAFHMLEVMSARIRELSTEVSALRIKLDEYSFFPLEQENPQILGVLAG